MDDVQGAEANAEPSMEEILASIRRIIADEKDSSNDPASEGPDALELTQMVQDDGSVIDVSEVSTPSPAPAVMPEPVTAQAAPPPPPEQTPVDTETLLSEKSVNVAASALSSLENKVQIERAASLPHTHTPLGHGERTLEEMVLELMKPMLKEWLDTNLPAVVERLVQKEVERIARKASE